jgi:hypothetical protein
VCEAAGKELAKLGAQVEPALREALKEKSTIEVRKPRHPYPAV